MALNLNMVYRQLRLLPWLLSAVFMSVAASATNLESIRAAFIEAAIEVCPADEEMNTQFILYSSHGRANDVLLQQLYLSAKLPDEEVEELLGLFTDEGCFSDIDYKDQTRGEWAPLLHVTRMQALARLYANPASNWHGDSRLGKLLHEAIAFWGRERPTCPNWWHNNIGVPKKFATVLLLLREELSEEELEVGLTVLENAKFGMTGQNKITLAGCQLMKGLLVDDEALVLEARNQIAEEICVTDKEGIQRDWSFHQHGPQLQFGNYGLAYLDVIAFWMRVLHGSEADFSAQHREIISNFLNEGLRWTVWEGIMDPSFCGRQVFQNSGRGKACALYVVLRNMAACAEEEVPDAIGARYFPCSDCGIYRATDWYASVRMHSERTIGFEFTNGENLGGWFSADGALMFMQHGREYEDIFACWDWRKLPGVTAYDDGKALKTLDGRTEKQNNSAHVGGAVFDDNSMLSSMEVNRDGIHALKSYFFLKNYVIALGTGISYDNEATLTTSLEQNRLSGETVAGSNWAWHDDRGYCTIDKAPLKVETGLQKGDWGLIDPALKGKKDSMEVFKCFIEHDPSLKNNTYAYALLPHFGSAQTRRFARRPKVKLLRNDTECQAIKIGGRRYAVIHSAGDYNIGHRTYHFDTPCFVLIKGKNTTTKPFLLNNNIN